MVEVVPKNQGVEVLYILKLAVKFTFGTYESIIDR
jgi:hypothetical protein